LNHNRRIENSKIRTPSTPIPVFSLVETPITTIFSIAIEVGSSSSPIKKFKGENNFLF
jgi:hypothetical protein